MFLLRKTSESKTLSHTRRRQDLAMQNVWLLKSGFQRFLNQNLRCLEPKTSEIQTESQTRGRHDLAMQHVLLKAWISTLFFPKP